MDINAILPDVQAKLIAETTYPPLEVMRQRLADLESKAVRTEREEQSISALRKAIAIVEG